MFIIRRDTFFFSGESKSIFGKLLRLFGSNSYHWTWREEDAVQYADFFAADAQARVFRDLGYSVTVEMRIKESN